jgi:hypothetical protein
MQIGHEPSITLLKQKSAFGEHPVTHSIGANIPMTNNLVDAVDYEKLVDNFNQALIVTLRKHNAGDTFLDFWVPDTDPVLGITGMVDSARISGRTELAVRFKSTTITEERIPELERAVSQFSSVTIQRNGDQLLLHATDLSNERSPRITLGTHHNGDKPAYWQAKALLDKPVAKPVTSSWDSKVLPDFADVHPHFRAALKTTLAHLTHVGNGGTANDSTLKLQAREGSICLTLDIDLTTHIVKAARHDGAFKPSEKAALDLFCRTAEGLPIQEVADHVGTKVIEALVDTDKAPPVTGILLPINAGAPFMIAPRLAREIYDAYRTSQAIRSETNFYYAPPSAQWMALSTDDRCERVSGLIRAFLQSEALYPDDLELMRIEKNKYGFEVRSVISFSERIKIQDKPFILRRLELRLRRDVEPQLELVADRAKDKSPLRRLS